MPVFRIVPEETAEEKKLKEQKEKERKMKKKVISYVSMKALFYAAGVKLAERLESSGGGMATYINLSFTR